MTNRDRVLEFLRSIAPSDASNEEIGGRTGIGPHQQVFQITQQLRSANLIDGRQMGKEWRFWAVTPKRAEPIWTPTREVPVDKSPVTQDSSGTFAKVDTSVPVPLSNGEAAYCKMIRQRDLSLRSYQEKESLAEPPDARLWFVYMIQVRDILGNVSNSISFLATLLAKEYLVKRFGVTSFDAAAKAQGAPGPDIEVRTPDGKFVRCEIKSTRPYQPGFGANQKNEILKDLKKLSLAVADHKLMMVTDPDAYATLCKVNYAGVASGIEIVNLLSGTSFKHV